MMPPSRNEMVIEFTSLPTLHLSLLHQTGVRSLLFAPFHVPSHNKINKAILEDLFRKIEFGEIVDPPFARLEAWKRTKNLLHWVYVERQFKLIITRNWMFHGIKGNDLSFSIWNKKNSRTIGTSTYPTTIHDLINLIVNCGHELCYIHNIF